MTDANGWPDPQRPGVPANPERHGWHWLAWDPAWPEPAYWDGEWSQSDIGNLTVKHARYIGPLHTPAEVAAQVAAAQAAGADAMREICVRAAMVELGWNNGSKDARKAIAMQAAHTVNAIRERPLPAPDALARAIAAAEARGMERAVGICDESYALSGRQLSACIRAAAKERQA